MSDYPWPLDPTCLTPEVRLALRRLSTAALREVTDAHPLDTGRGLVVPGADHDVCAKATRLAFEALRIPYERVTSDEFSRRVVALGRFDEQQAAS